MQMNNLADIWDEFLGYVNTNSKNPGYINWIKAALPLSMNEDTFEIGVKNYSSRNGSNHAILQKSNKLFRR